LKRTLRPVRLRANKGREAVFSTSTVRKKRRGKGEGEVDLYETLTREEVLFSRPSRGKEGKKFINHGEIMGGREKVGKPSHLILCSRQEKGERTVGRKKEKAPFHTRRREEMGDSSTSTAEKEKKGKRTFTLLPPLGRRSTSWKSVEGGRECSFYYLSWLRG